MKKKILRFAIFCFFSLTILPVTSHADAVTDTIGIYVGYYGWQESDYVEKVTYHWSELDDWAGGVLDTQETIFSYYSGSRTYLVAARGFTIRDLLYYAGIDFGSIASIDFFTKDHDNGAYRSFSKYSLFDQPRYYFPNLAANEETGEIYPWDGDDIWNGATAVEAVLALEDYTEWDTVGSEFEQRYDSTLLSPNCRFHLFFGQSEPGEASTSSAAKYCYKILVTFSGTPVLSTEETDMSLKIGSGKKIEVTVDAEDGLLNDYVRQHISWGSSDEGVLTVSEDGTINVIAAGEAVVTASFGQSAVSVHVNVEADEEPQTEDAGGTGGDGAGESSGYSAGSTETAPTSSEGNSEGTALPSEPEPSEVIHEQEPTEIEEEPLPVIEEALPEPSEPPVEITAAPAERLIAISAESLAGMLKSNDNGESTSGSIMDDDSTQLVIDLSEESRHTALVVGLAAFAFAFGFCFEIIRFKRLLNKE